MIDLGLESLITNETPEEFCIATHLTEMCEIETEMAILAAEEVSAQTKDTQLQMMRDMSAALKAADEADTSLLAYSKATLAVLDIEAETNLEFATAVDAIIAHNEEAPEEADASMELLITGTAAIILSGVAGGIAGYIVGTIIGNLIIGIMKMIGVMEPFMQGLNNEPKNPKKQYRMFTKKQLQSRIQSLKKFMGLATGEIKFTESLVADMKKALEAGDMSVSDKFKVSDNADIKGGITCEAAGWSGNTCREVWKDVKSLSGELKTLSKQANKEKKAANADAKGSADADKEAKAAAVVHAKAVSSMVKGALSVCKSSVSEFKRISYLFAQSAKPV